MSRRIFMVLLLLCFLGSAGAEDRRLLGVWRAVTYEVQGTGHPMTGLFIFSRRHYSANIRYPASHGPIDNANGNAGPYAVAGGKIVFTQWVQVHVRPDDAKEPVLARAGPDEATEYRIEGKRLILTFPSKNRYVLERLEDSPTAGRFAPHDGPSRNTAQGVRR